MAEKINERAVIVWQSAIDGEHILVGEPALLVRSYGGMIGITQEDKEEVLINVESFPVLRKIMKAMETDGDFKGLRL